MNSTDETSSRLAIVKLAAPALCVLLPFLSSSSSGGEDPGSDLLDLNDTTITLGDSDKRGGALVLLLSSSAFLVPRITGKNTVFGMMVLIYTAVPKGMFVEVLFFVLFFLATVQAELLVREAYEQKQWSTEPLLALEDFDSSTTQNNKVPETTPSTLSRSSTSDSMAIVSTGDTDAAEDQEDEGSEAHVDDVAFALWSENMTSVIAGGATVASIVFGDAPESAGTSFPAAAADPIPVQTNLVIPDIPITNSGAAVSPPIAAQAIAFLDADGPNVELLQPEEENTDGAFGDILFVSVKATGEALAFKTCKDTAGGRRQMEREVQVLSKIWHGKLPNIVEVLEIRMEPKPMLLMRREPYTFSSKLKEYSNSEPREIANMMCDVLSAVDGLSGIFGYLHRDLKPDNILIDEHGHAKLTDFGMCVKIEDARLSENIGDGTPAYSAPETSTPEGATMLSEIYAVAVIFIEGLINNCPFGEEELLTAARDRLDDLEAQREDLIERIEIEQGDEGEEGEDEESDEETSIELELIRLKEHRLGVANEDGWAPNGAAETKLAEMGEPLSFFTAGSEEHTPAKDKRGDMARREAQGNPHKLFEDNWVEWLTTYSRAECDEGLRLAVRVVLDGRMLHPDPKLRPQSVEAAREVVLEALAVYEAAERAEKSEDGH